MTVTVNLLPLVCSDGTVRLGNQSYGNTIEGYFFTEGRVEVCINGTFGPICSGPHWDEVDAAVVCRYSGYHPPVYCKLSHIIALQSERSTFSQKQIILYFKFCFIVVPNVFTCLTCTPMKIF